MNFKEALIAHLQGESVECKATDSKWSDFVGCFGHMSMDKLRDLTYVGWEFRLAPRTIFVNGVEVPAGEKEEPQRDTEYFVSNPMEEDKYTRTTWTDHDLDNVWFERGLVYLNKEDAIARAKAMLLTSDK